MINAITAMDAPRMIKDVQMLTGCMAALNQFNVKLLKLHDKFQRRKGTTLLQIA
jgi:hypothetical protein